MHFITPQLKKIKGTLQGFISVKQEKQKDFLYFSSIKEATIENNILEEVKADNTFIGQGITVYAADSHLISLMPGIPLSVMSLP